MKIRPPIVATAYLLIALLLDRVLPDPRIIDETYRFAGAVVFVIGLAVSVWAINVFRKIDTTHEPFGRPTALAVHGPYRLSRNPMYVGVALALVGIAIFTGRALFFLVPVAFIFTINSSHIPREEKLLQDIFGTAYDEFRQRVRRWL